MRITAICLALLPAVSNLAAQENGPAGDPITNAGVVRATLLFDSVFVDREVDDGYVDGGAWGSYLLDRMGVFPIPDDLLFRVSVDANHIEMFGTIADLPLATRHALAPILGFFSPETTLIARITLNRRNAVTVDFRLSALAINGREFPEAALATFLAQIGKKYPTLTHTGRDLLLTVPREGVVELEDGRVRLRMR